MSYCKVEYCDHLCHGLPFYFNGYIAFRFLIGLSSLEKINLSFTEVSDIGLRRLCGLSSLKSLNLDARQITDSGLAVLTSMYYHVKLQLEQWFSIFIVLHRFQILFNLIDSLLNVFIFNH